MGSFLGRGFGGRNGTGRVRRLKEGKGRRLQGVGLRSELGISGRRPLYRPGTEGWASQGSARVCRQGGGTPLLLLPGLRCTLAGGSGTGTGALAGAFTSPRRVACGGLAVPGRGLRARASLSSEAPWDFRFQSSLQTLSTLTANSSRTVVSPGPRAATVGCVVFFSRVSCPRL